LVKGLGASGGWFDCDENDFITVNVIDPHAWFQTQGGDVYGQSGISSPIPTACVDSSSCSEYFSLALYGFAGLVSSPGGTSRNFGSGSAVDGETTWSVDGDLSWVKNAYFYSYFANLLDIACEEGQGEGNNSYNDNVSCSFAVSSVDSKPDFSSYSVYVYQANTNSFSISGDLWNLGDEKGIVLISFDDPSNGVVTANPEISVGENGFFALITNGSIEFTQGTSSYDSTSPQVEGVYFAGKNIKTDDENLKFISKGIFFVKEGFVLQLDLTEGGNATSPSELFIFDPKYLFTAPKIFRVFLQQWQEVAP